jgi:hypothetical protein
MERGDTSRWCYGVREMVSEFPELSDNSLPHLSFDLGGLSSLGTTLPGAFLRNTQGHRFALSFLVAQGIFPFKYLVGSRSEKYICSER